MSNILCMTAKIEKEGKCAATEKLTSSINEITADKQKIKLSLHHMIVMWKWQGNDSFCHLEEFISTIVLTWENRGEFISYPVQGFHQQVYKE